MTDEMFPKSRTLIADTIADIERNMTPRERLEAIEVPRRMRTLAKDARGYPVPFLVMVDKSGTPQFTINDHAKVHDCISKHLCAICGKRFDRNAMMHREMWFVGGSRCFLHERGAFLDPPLHLECAEYALRVCPFLAASRYMRRVDAKKLDPNNLPDGMAIVQEGFAMPRLPEIFGLGMTHRYRVISQGSSPVFVVDDWRYLEWWRAGEPVNAPETGVAPPIEEFAV